MFTYDMKSKSMGEDGTQLSFTCGWVGFNYITCGLMDS